MIKMKKQNSRPTPVQVIVTDTHVNTENYPLIIDIFQQFIDLIKSLGLNTGIHMGDFFTSRASQSLMCLLTTTLILDMFEKEEITLYIIPGNHDKTDLESEESYLTIFNNRTYVTLFEKESFIDDNGINYCFLPYFKEGTEYLQRLSNLNEMVGNFMLSVLFTHISINGVRNNDGSVVDGDVEADFFDNFDLVFTGHYHDRSSVKSNIHYVGEDENKGFTVLCKDLSFYHVQSNFPHYRKFIVRTDEFEEVTKELLPSLKDSTDHVRFVFKGTQTEIDSINPNLFMAAGIDVKFENVSEQGILFDDVQEAEVMNFDKKTILKSYLQYAILKDFTPYQKKVGINLINKIKF
jgi:hypothetical protein